MSVALVGADAGRVISRRRELDEDPTRDLRYYNSAYTLAGDDSTDDTNALNEAFAAVPANSSVVVPPGTYKITGTVFIALTNAYHVDARGAIFKFYGSGASVAVQVGVATPTSVGTATSLTNGTINCLDVRKSAKDWTNAVVGIRFQNLRDWIIAGIRVDNFKTGIECRGYSNACAYCSFEVTRVFDCETGFTTAQSQTYGTGYTNECSVYGGDWSYTTGAGAWASTWHIKMVDTAGTAAPNNWRFYGSSFQAPVGNYDASDVLQTGTGLCIIPANSQAIQFYGCRAETVDHSNMGITLAAASAFCMWWGGIATDLTWLDSAASTQYNVGYVNGIWQGSEFKIVGTNPKIRLQDATTDRLELIMDETAQLVKLVSTTTSGSNRSMAFLFGSTEVFRITSTGIQLASGLSLVAGGPTGIKIGSVNTEKIGFLGSTPVAQPAALVQTYATSNRTLAAYTTNAQSVAYTGAADGEAKLTDLNLLRVAYENLRASHDSLIQHHNALVDDLQLYGLET